MKLNARLKLVEEMLWVLITNSGDLGVPYSEIRRLENLKKELQDK